MNSSKEDAKLVEYAKLVEFTEKCIAFKYPYFREKTNYNKYKSLKDIKELKMMFNNQLK